MTKLFHSKMIKKSVIIFCVLHPFIIGILFFIYNMEYVWSVSENYKIYDLIYATISYLLFSVGFVALRNKRKATGLIALIIIFVVYQVLTWPLSYKPYIAHLNLNHKNSILLATHDGGALSSSSFVSLELIEKKYLILIKYKRIKIFDNIRSAKLELTDSRTVKIELMPYVGESILEYVDIDI